MNLKVCFQIFVVTAATSYAGFLLSRRASFAYASTRPVPLTAEYIETDFDASGVPIQTSTTAFAQMADGSFAVLPKGLGTGAVVPKRILDIKSKRMVTVDPATMSLTTYPYSDDDLVQYRNPPATCRLHPNFTRDQSVQQKIFGHEVQRFAGTVPGTSNVSEKWLAPELNCMVLREIISIAGGFKFSREIKRLTLGEPDPTLLEIPASGFTERRPSEVLTLANQKLGIGPSTKTAHTYSALDGVYLKRQKR